MLFREVLPHRCTFPNTRCGLLEHADSPQPSLETYRGLLHRSSEFRATDELFTGELHVLMSLRCQVARRCCAESAYCKHMFQVFQRYVVSVSYGCCKSRSGCCICCKCFRDMLQGFVQTILCVSDIYCKRFNLDVAYVSHICCKCVFQMFHLVQTYTHICCKRMFTMFHLVSDVCCSKCCSLRALTREHVRTPIVRCACNGLSVPVKVHARM